MDIWSAIKSLFKPQEGNKPPVSEHDNPGSAGDLLLAYLKTPSPEGFLRLRDAVARSKGYAPYTHNYKEQAFRLLEKSQYEEALQYVMSIGPNYILSPGIHKVAGFIHHKLGNSQEKEYEFQLAALMTSGILSTGDGSKSRPYLVLHPADEYDILEALEKEKDRQSLHSDDDDRFYDCLLCKDGSVIWFDITIPFAVLAARSNVTLDEFRKIR